MAWALFTAAYFTVCVQWARNKGLWFDEFITWQVSQVPMDRLLEALRTGADANPPLFHLITRASLALFGSDALGLRIPAAAGYWLMMLCLYLVLRRRCSEWAAWAGALLPLVWQMRTYAMEARAYGLMFGFAALALLCWVRATEEGEAAAAGGRPGSRRWMWIAGLAASLVAGVSSHYFAIFAALPVATGELYRWRVRGRMDWPVALTALAMAVPLIAFLPLMAGARQYAADAWSMPKIAMIPGAYLTLIGLASGEMALLAALTILWLAYRRDLTATTTAVMDWPGHWIAAAAALALLPVAAVLFAKVVTKAFVARYAGITVLGFAMAAAWSVEWLWRRRLAGAAVLVTLGIAGQGIYHGWKEAHRVEPLSVDSWIRQANRYPDLPVVVDTTLYYDAIYYTPPAIRDRVRMFADPGLAWRQSGNSAAETGVLNMAKVRPLPGLVHYESFTAAHPVFLHVSDPGRNPWVLRRLVADGAAVTVVATDPELVYLVRVKP
jgi:hypothetical protein